LEPAPADARVEKCEKAINYVFREKALLMTALRHASAADEETESNQRQEFLGDAVLGIIVAHCLYERFPTMAEGNLTRIKSLLVSRSGLTKIAEKLKIGELVELGPGVESEKKTLPESITTDAFEALVGAVYLDGGFDAARKMILEAMNEELEAVLEGEPRNCKSILQHLSQVRFGCLPEYAIRNERGPDHNKEFEVQVIVNGSPGATAWGKTKKEAEQAAAREELKRSFPYWENYSF